MTHSESETVVSRNKNYTAELVYNKSVFLLFHYNKNKIKNKSTRFFLNFSDSGKNAFDNVLSRESMVI